MDTVLDPLFCSRLQKLSGDAYEQVLRSFTLPKIRSLRVDHTRISRKEVIAVLKDQSIQAEPVPAIPEAVVLSTEETLSRVQQTRLYQEGLLYPQGLSSMLPVLCLDPQPNELILDIAAAPGSKTTQIAQRMGHTGQIVANDISWERIKKLNAVLSQNHVTNVTIIQFPGQVVWRDYADTFDRVLVDVPCSMEGRIRIDDPETYNDWSLKRIKELSTRQKGILRSAIRCVKPGGIVVYSTCTLAPEENEEVIDWILRKEGETVKVEPITLPDVPTVAGIQTWGENEYAPAVTQSRRILPNTTWEGFYVCCLRRHT